MDDHTTWLYLASHTYPIAQCYWQKLWHRNTYHSLANNFCVSHLRGAYVHIILSIARNSSGRHTVSSLDTSVYTFHTIVSDLFLLTGRLRQELT